MIATLGAVSATASATVSKTGAPATLLPLPPGVTPETTLVPYSTICSVWNEPSRPVMPCTNTRVSRSTRMLTERTPLRCSFGAARAYGRAGSHSYGVCRADGLRGRFVHVIAGRQPCLGEEAPPFLSVGSGKPHDDWHRDFNAPQRFADALGNDVAPRDAAEDIDENGAHIRVGGDDAERLGNLIGARAAADVEEVCGLPSMKHHGVHGRHCQPGAIDDAPDVAAELDERDSRLTRIELGRVFGIEVAQRLETGMTEQRVVVDGHLGVECEPLAIPGQNQWVDLGKRGVFSQIGVVELSCDRCEPGHPIGGQSEREADLSRLPGMETEKRVDQGPHNPLWSFASDFFDLDATLSARHDDVLTTRAIERDAEVDLLGDVDGGRDQHLAHDVSANVQTEDRRGGLAGLLSGAGKLDAAGLAATSGQHLGFDDDRTACGLGQRSCLIGGCGDITRIRADAMVCEDLRRLVLVQIHYRVLAFQSE